MRMAATSGWKTEGNPAQDMLAFSYSTNAVKAEALRSHFRFDAGNLEYKAFRLGWQIDPFIAL